MADICTFGLDGIYTFNWEYGLLFSGKLFNIFNQMACFTGYIHLCRRLLMECFRHLANFNQCDFWNVLKKVLFVTKFPAVNLYSRTPLTRVGLLQFPLDWLSTTVYREKDCFVMFKLVLLYNTIVRSDVSLTDWHML